MLHTLEHDLPGSVPADGNLHDRLSLISATRASRVSWRPYVGMFPHLRFLGITAGKEVGTHVGHMPYRTVDITTQDEIYLFQIDLVEMQGPALPKDPMYITIETS